MMQLDDDFRIEVEVVRHLVEIDAGESMTL